MKRISKEKEEKIQINLPVLRENKNFGISAVKINSQKFGSRFFMSNEPNNMDRTSSNFNCKKAIMKNQKIKENDCEFETLSFKSFDKKKLKEMRQFRERIKNQKKKNIK